MESVFNEQILEDKLTKLNSTQQCIETLSHWCIFHRSKAETVVTTWEKIFHGSEMAQKVPLLYLANDILQNSKRKGNEFVTEFWKVLPKALKEVDSKGDDRGKNVVSRLVGIWEERKVFGSHAASLKDTMLGEESPPPLEIGKKRPRSVQIVKRNSRSIRTKLTVGGTAERIVSAFNLALNECSSKDREMKKCKSTIQRLKKMEKDVDEALSKANDPSRKTLFKELEEEENVLKHSIDKLKVVEANRLALVSQLREALQEQETELENIRTQTQVAQAHIEESSNTRKRLNGDHIINKGETNKKSAAAELADKLVASNSSEKIMTAVLSTLAAEAAKSSEQTNNKQENFVPAQVNNNHFQPHIHGQFSNQQPIYHQNPPPIQYLQQLPGGVAGSYDYMVGPMVHFNQQQVQAQAIGHQQQQPPNFVPQVQAPPGTVYYAHPYQSQ